jgi:hypothetical protein
VKESGVDKIYRRCPYCLLIQLEPAFHLTPRDEKARYDEHNNDAGDERYLDFLKRLADPLCGLLAKGEAGLDFGCGPTPALAAIFTGRGFPTSAYDPFYFPDEKTLEHRYRFVAASEVFEHLREPAREIRRIDSLLEEGGFLAVMTRLYDGSEPFERWWYRRDPTHISFFSRPTMAWIAAEMGWQARFPSETVTLFSKPARLTLSAAADKLLA